ncbi:ABC transporter substrate-binding protein [Psychromarinibacter halotolerans]|uniref:ABC transporter substrate-binding protein n=1 Tax=Psychromarinibacter halotolerans TaxID=1775175 RepID=A0ABV7GSH2_9RHOB|nr:extracellular solute-binding protein [Psychromarinibacter halotolerans]MDF0598551.1 extracellular solute-binding protein [Psychromarinibacter halotolerans]
MTSSKRAARLCAVLLATTAASGAMAQTQITMWHQEQVQPRIDQFQVVIDAFNASQDEYEVVQQVQGWGNIYQVLPPAVDAGIQPDIQFTIPDFTVTVRDTGAVQPVTEFVAELDEAHGFIDQAALPYTDDGEVWAVPVYGMVQVLWYRKDMFEAAGLDPETPPATWEDLLSAAETLTGEGVYGIGIPASQSLATDQVFYSFMATNNDAELFDADGNVIFDNPQTVATLEFYKQLADLSPSGIGSWTWAEPQDALNAGAVAMAIEKGQYLSTFETASGQPSEMLGCAPVPVADGGERASIYYSNAAMIMTDDPERRAGAEAFLSFVLEPENYAEFLLAEPGLFLPLTEDGATDAWKNAEALAPYQSCLDLMTEQSAYGMLPGFNIGEVQDAIGPIAAQNILAQVVQRAIIGDETAADAVAWGQAQMESAIAE